LFSWNSDACNGDVVMKLAKIIIVTRITLIWTSDFLALETNVICACA
jgi:hypothetical protein